MAGNSRSQRLELTWFNKDKALIPTETGKYDYAWVDPTDPRYCQTRPLVMGDYVEGVRGGKVEGVTYSERADLEPSTDNLLINGESGDVLEALTRVPELADEYVGKVKCCYIDPPFNTEKTFTHYADNLEHSIWLTMMRDRLVHIKKLLSADGSIWVHLDESENHRMRVLLDEVFGPGNFVAEVAWEKTYSPENRSIFTQSHDVILLYAKSLPGFKAVRNLLPRSAAQNAAYTNPDDDPRGVWKPGDFTAQAGRGTATQFYTLTTPSGRRLDPPPGACWRYTEPRYRELLDDNRVYFGSDGQGRPALKRFLTEVMQGRVPDSVWYHSVLGHNDTAKKEIKSLFPGVEPFDTPKPERLLERIIHIATNPGDVVLDVFGGSGTTAAVAHKMGRRWVTCELLESNFSTFTRPRLEKVVRGEDPGGITHTAGERVDATEDGLPDGLSPDEAQKLTSLLNKAIKDRPDLKTSTDVKTIKSLVRTRNSGDIVNWRGGGGFQVATLAPPCFDYSPEADMVTLTDAALTGDTLARSVAAHLGFTLTPDHPLYTAKRGRTYLLVTTRPIGPGDIDDLVAHLDAGETLTVAATAMDSDAAQALRAARKGSRILHVPNDVFRVADNAAKD